MFSCRVALILLLATPTAFGQGVEEDLLTPLAPPSASKPRSERKTTMRKPKARQADSDDLITPLVVVKTGVRVQVAGDVKGAVLVVDGNEVGAVSSDVVELPAGAHHLMVRRPGYGDYSRKLKLREGRVVSVKARLKAVEGVLSVTADVAGARVFVDGMDMGAVPLEGLVLKPGKYAVDIRREGFERNLHIISVRAGKDYAISANLRPAVRSEPVVSAPRVDRPEAPVLKPSVPPAPEVSVPLASAEPQVVASADAPWYGRWYVWAGVGVVAAAAVGAVVVTQQAGAPQPLNPRDVCGGDCQIIINSPGIVRF